MADPDWVGRVTAGLVGSSFTIVVGWILRSLEAEERELVDLIEQALEELEAIEELSIEVWIEINSELTIEENNKIIILTGKLHRLQVIGMFVGDKIKNFGEYEYTDNLSALRRSITLDKGGVYFDPMPESAERISVIMSRGTKLGMILRKMRRSVIPGSFIRKIRGIFN